ncbi:MAG: hypothetical protein C5B59_02525 [Bacteroidetes bacterium]|nr:MAG: hypothetical protein C5B59_02525 [Bacteroidota bacterium]
MNITKMCTFLSAHRSSWNKKGIYLSLAILFSLSCFKSLAQGGSRASAVYNILEYGARPDGQSVNTAAIQKAVNDCHEHGGGRIEIPTGIFVTGTIRLYSNMELHLEAGAVLSGSLNDSDYLYQKDFGFSGPGAGGRTGILVAHDEQNISLTGPGRINGRGKNSMWMDSLQKGADFDRKFTRQRDLYMDSRFGRKDGPVLWKGNYESRPGVMIIFSNCKRIYMDQVKFQESPNWTVAFLLSEDIHINGVTIENNMSIPNSDGIDFYDSKFITVSNCFIQAGDDAIAVVSSSSLVVSNCVLHSRSCGIRVGYNVFNDHNSGDLLFNNITIYDSNRGIGIFQRREGDMKNMTFSNINIQTRLHSGQWWGHGEPIHISSLPGLGSKKAGSISQVRFSNITAFSESGIVMIAASKGLIRDISFDHVDLTITVSPLNNGYGGNFDLRPVNDISKGIFSHNIPALYADLVSQLHIHDMSVRWNQGLPAYFRHAIECRNCDGLNIYGLQEFLPFDETDHRGETIYLHKGGTADLQKIRSSNPDKKLTKKDNMD